MSGMAHTGGKTGLFHTSIQIFEESAIENTDKISSEYIKSYISYFLWIHPKLLIISSFCSSFTLYVKLLIDTGAQIDLIRRDIT